MVVQEIVIQGGMEQGDHFDDEIYQKRWNKDVDVGHGHEPLNLGIFQEMPHCLPMCFHDLQSLPDDL